MPARSDASDRVRLATPADRDTVVATVVAAFGSDPAFRWFFPDPATFDARASAFVAAVLRPRLAAEAVWIVDDGAAVALWEPPGAGGGGVADAVPAETYARLQRWEDAAHRFIPDDPHWYLGILATHPAHAGRGLAKLAAAPGWRSPQPPAGRRGWRPRRRRTSRCTSGAGGRRSARSTSTA